MPVIPALRKLNKENHDLETSPDYIEVQGHIATLVLRKQRKKA
jgi:hypothetical protein